MSAANTAQIKIGANTYTQTGFLFDGPTLQSGTMTLLTAVSVVDGAAGNFVINSSRTIWLTTGQQIAFDYGGAVSVFFDINIDALHVTNAIAADGGLLLDYDSGTKLFWDPTAFEPSGGAHLQGNLMVTGRLNTANGMTIGGESHLTGPVSVIETATFSDTCAFRGAVSMSAGLTVSCGQLVATDGATIMGGLSVGGGTIALPSYTVATLPTATAGALAYASDGRTSSEAAGAGTGVLVVGGSSGRWTSVMSGTAVLE